MSDENKLEQLAAVGAEELIPFAGLAKGLLGLWVPNNDKALGAALVSSLHDDVNKLVGAVADLRQFRQESLLVWAELVAALVKIRMEQLSDQDQRQARVRLTEDREALGVVLNYYEQAYREPLDERRRMMAHASAGIVDLRLSVAQHARVERALRELEPDEVLELYRIWLIPSGVPSAKYHPRHQRLHSHGALRNVFWQAARAEGLQSSGCIRVHTVSGGAGAGAWEELSLTTLGWHVLRQLRTYVLAREPSLVHVPGHEVTADFRDEEAAGAVLAQFPALRSSLRSAGFRANVVIYDGLSIIDGALANGKTRLRLQLPVDAAQALAEAMPDLKLEQGHPADTIYVERVGGDVGPDGTVEVAVAGPHDVLRFLAYELWAHWA